MSFIKKFTEMWRESMALPSDVEMIDAMDEVVFSTRMAILENIDHVRGGTGVRRICFDAKHHSPLSKLDEFLMGMDRNGKLEVRDWSYVVDGGWLHQISKEEARGQAVKEGAMKMVADSIRKTLENSDLWGESLPAVVSMSVFARPLSDLSPHERRTLDNLIEGKAEIKVFTSHPNIKFYRLKSSAGGPRSGGGREPFEWFPGLEPNMV